MNEFDRTDFETKLILATSLILGGRGGTTDEEVRLAMDTAHEVIAQANELSLKVAKECSSTD